MNESRRNYYVLEVFAVGAELRWSKRDFDGIRSLFEEATRLNVSSSAVSGNPKAAAAINGMNDFSTQLRCKMNPILECYAKSILATNSPLFPDYLLVRDLLAKAIALDSENIVLRARCFQYLALVDALRDLQDSGALVPAETRKQTDAIVRLVGLLLDGDLEQFTAELATVQPLITDPFVREFFQEVIVF